MRNLMLGVCIAPYRIDLYNYLYTHFNCEIYFQYEDMILQNFNMESLYNQCCYKPHFLKCRTLGRRNIVHGLRKIIKKYCPEYIFVPEFSILTIQVLLIKYLYNYKYKVISICDDSYDMLMGNDFSIQHRWARRIITPLLDNLFLVDNRVHVWYQKHYKKGVWMPIISDDIKARRIYEALLPLSVKINRDYGLEGYKVILFVGRLVALKNVSSLIKAYSPLKQMAKLVIIGDGECRGDLEKLDRKLETKAIFVGRKEGDELLAWYNIADIFVLPSVQEAFGAVTNEALLAGCYTLVSEKAGSSSIIHSGFNGEIFNPHSTIELTQLLKIQINKLDSKDNIKLKDNLMPYSFVNMLDRALQGIVGS